MKCSATAQPMKLSALACAPRRYLFTVHSRYLHRSEFCPEVSGCINEALAVRLQRREPDATRCPTPARRKIWCGKHSCACGSASRLQAGLRRIGTVAVPAIARNRGGRRRRSESPRKRCATIVLWTQSISEKKEACAADSRRLPSAVSSCSFLRLVVRALPGGTARP